MRLRGFQVVCSGFLLASNLSGQAPQAFDRLEPVPAYDRLGYSQTVFQVLVREQMPELWMIVKPSFSPEYAVVLGRVWSEEIPRKLIRYELRWVRAKKPIWHQERIGNTNSFRVAPLKDPGIEERTVEFPPEATSQISKAWSRIIRESRYPSSLHAGVDGVTYEFYAHYNLFGTTWGPQSGAPAMMVELGEALIDYVQANPINRDKALQLCIEKAKQLQEYSFR